MGRADEAAITVRFVALEPVLDEQLRRLVAAAEAQAAGPRGHLSSCAGDWCFAQSDPNWKERTGTTASFRRGKREFEGRSPDPKTGRWTEEERRQRSDADGGSGEVGGTSHAWRSGIASAMDVQERSCSCLGAPVQGT